MLGPCGAPDCSANAMMGANPCQFCRKSMCVRHLVPESHGCRDAAKNAARMFATKDAAEVLAARKAHENREARDKLAAKREELAKQRARKPPAKK